MLSILKSFDFLAATHSSHSDACLIILFVSIIFLVAISPVSFLLLKQHVCMMMAMMMDTQNLT